ncbi:hypothetical protein [Micromonospora sp. NPDC049301]|uniref:hypothetical protein n=1 Tax=Micromonospora sp. NPDC049301 TaxID=3155723 RepID=UPI003415E54D
MKRSRIASALLILAATTALAACGDGDKATTAGSSSPAPTSAAPTSAAPSTAATPTAPAASGASDKTMCESAQKAGDEMKAELVAIATAGEPSAADFKKILTGLDQKVTEVAAGGDSKVATALRQFGVLASKAAAAPDPAAAADNPAFEKAGADITAACKAAGVSVNF